MSHASHRAFVVKLLVSLAVVLALSVALRVHAEETPQPGAKTDAAAICHQCEWIKIQIGDIDDKIASWQRQIRSIQKYADLSDPRIQNALGDINKTIAQLQAKKADLEAQLAECQKRCAEAKAAQQPQPSPVTPNPLPGPTNGGGTGGGGTGGGGTDNGGGTGNNTGGGTGGSTNSPSPNDEPCPPNSPMGQSSTSPQGVGGGKLLLPPPMPPAPKDKAHLDDWNHMLDHMDWAEDPYYGDDEDVWDVADDIDDAIDDAYDELAKNPNDADAKARLEWLKAARDYYGRWKAWIRNSYRNSLWLDPGIYHKCWPKLDLAPQKQNKRPSSVWDHFSIGIGLGIGVGGGGHEREGDRGRRNDNRDSRQEQGAPRD